MRSEQRISSLGFSSSPFTWHLNGAAPSVTVTLVRWPYT